MIMTQRVTMRVIQAAQTIVRIDEGGAAINLAGMIVNQPAEEGRSGRGIRTPFAGRIEFNEVTFKDPGTTAPALDRVSFTIPEGSVFGIVGHSASGKTTGTRLLPALPPNLPRLIHIHSNIIRDLSVTHHPP